MTSAQSNVLIVDDELFFRKLYQDLLLEEGYRVDICDNGDDAIALLQQRQVDVVLTDMVMPGSSGLDVLRVAKALSNPPDVILVTGHASLESAIDALKSGARDYLVKPFNPEELKHVVRNCLDQRELLTENDHLKRQIQLFQTGQTLSTVIDLDLLIPQALDVLMREMTATVGCAFSLKDGVTPVVSTVKNIPVEFAEKLVNVLLSQMDKLSGLGQPGEEFEVKLTKLQYSRKQIWMLPLCDGTVLKGGIVLCDVPDPLVKHASFGDLRYLCDQIVLGYANACRYQDAQELMYTDDLTGLYNHRYMQISLNREIKRAHRYGLKFSLLFLDLDRFKEINDAYGHLAGSAALQEVGSLLVDCVRDVDTLFRFGGDEFAAILVETDDTTARIVAERIRKVIEEHAFLQDRESPSYVTVTAGFATFPTDSTDKEKLLDLADRAMYVGKTTRNVICGVNDIPDDER
ncbi:response regulator receiver modulated diguanylate cyclase [Desulfuromusa kysingii]|uniref:diguanylate cyclase n=1 Tax=Desulfuromusa kysingii TaxID=37625 RepID=A0A1H4EAG1_9BACT|nr:diguanylate cyclase [Desulfuromusa kysingii]SEA81926.1 response regulator receiver modulated diguanylate cyclase [Desulfuromusa kysingii]